MCTDPKGLADLASASVAMMFVTSGLVQWDYAVFFFCVCLCGVRDGKIYNDAHVKKLERLQF